MGECDANNGKLTLLKTDFLWLCFRPFDFLLIQHLRLGLRECETTAVG